MFNIRVRMGGPDGGPGVYLAAVRMLEPGVPLSRSRLWDLAAGSDASAPAAFAPGIAAAAARFCAAHPEALVLELGAGDGAFTRALLAALPPSTRVVATDPDAERANRLARALRSDVKSGRLDVARYDVRREPNVAPITPGSAVLQGGTAAVLVVSHGLLGALPADLLRFRDGRIAEALVFLTSPMSVPDPPRPQHLPKLELRWEWRATDDRRYVDRRLNAALSELVVDLDDAVVPIPVGAIAAVDRLAALSTGPFAILGVEGVLADATVLDRVPPPEDRLALPLLWPAVARAGDRSALRAHGDHTVVALGRGVEVADLVDVEPIVAPIADARDGWSTLRDALAAGHGAPDTLVGLDVDATDTPADAEALRAALLDARRRLDALLADADLPDRLDRWLASLDR
jgi:hypothetical protein